MLKEILTKAIDVMKINLNLIQPILLFMIILGLSFKPLANAEGNFTATIIILVTIFGLLFAFVSGFFNMVKKAVEITFNPELNDLQKLEASYKTYGDFAEGIGKYFLQFVFVSLINLILFGIGIVILGVLIKKYIGFPDFYTTFNPQKVFANETAAKTFLNSITMPDKLKLVKINTITTFYIFLFSYLTMFVPISIVMEDANPIKAYWIGLKKVFKKPMVTFSIYTLFFIFLTIISIVNLIAVKNIFLGFISILLNVSVLSYFIIVLFLYYDKTQENNRNNRTDRVGEE